MKKYSKTEHALMAFETVISNYQESASASGSIQAVNYEQNEGGKATYIGRSCVVTPSRSDFIADVELNVRRALSPLEHRHFKDWYQSLAVVVSDRPAMCANTAFLDNRVREKLGARFIQVKMFPLTIYRASVDVSRTMVRGVKVQTGEGIHLVPENKSTKRIVCVRAA